jgi:hypothetical protein
VFGPANSCVRCADSRPVPPLDAARSPERAIVFSAVDEQGVIAPSMPIQVIDDNGGNAFAPAGDLAGDYQTNPDWSPDGEWLTFANSEGERDDLYVMRVDGSELRKVYDCESPCRFIDASAWSPDGASIAAGKGSDDPASPSVLVSIDVETGAETVLFEPGPDHFVAGPRWSPDGTQIVLEVGTFEGPVTDAEIAGVVLSVLDLSTRSPSALG